MESGADLLVLGRHELSNRPLPATLRYVITCAPCPVVIVPPMDSESENPTRAVSATPTTSIRDIGLTSAQVAERRAAGQVNIVPDRTSRTYVDIARSNVFTRFNAIISVLAAVILAVGHPIDALFALVMVFNSVIGIVQEARAKHTLDRLKVLIAPTTTVIRDGCQHSVAPSDIVIDDLVVLHQGDQVVVDAVVVESQALEVDESALTGESDPVAKGEGDGVRSGSAVIAGTATVTTTHVGSDVWIHQLVEEAKEFVLTTSEIRSGVDQLLRVVGWLIGPLGALLLWSQLRGESDSDEALVSTVAGLVGLVPQGLVLLISMAMAVAVIRLGQNHVVVQELHAVEGLSRIDVLCVDKTGTLTTGQFDLDDLICLTGDPNDLRTGLGALVASETSPTSSTVVLAAAIDTSTDWTATTHVAFSSARKWSGTSFEAHGTWMIGAPEVLLDAAGSPTDDTTRATIADLASKAKRVLLVAHSQTPLGEDAELPPHLEPIGLVVLSEQLRRDAAEIMRYFAQQHVDVKVISGDNAATVAAVARRLEMTGADQYVDLRLTGDTPLDEIVETNTVFGRVLPEQKRALVEALQRAGHNVAMTGDGVNDIPAMKRADIGIAMDTATAATKSVAQLVLLDGRFDRLPNVVAEGRRVVANMERVSSLFVTKTVYAAIFVLATGLSGAVFPFLPRHMSLVSELTIGVPAFLLSFRAANQPTRPGYLGRVLRFAVPAGVVAAAVTLTTYWLVKVEPIAASLAEARTASTFALVLIAFWVLHRLIRPTDRYDTMLLIGLMVAFGMIVAAPPTRAFYALDWPDVRGVGVVAGTTIGSILLLQASLRWFHR